ncbi:MAG: four helix bundle protein [Pirellulales bacterium]|nr:four helix bundle protein [Pirellulales bacterium]
MTEKLQKQDLRERTMNYALRIIHLSTSLPNNPAAWVIGKQVLKSGTSVGAHYREGCRSRSVAEFISKLEGGLQELDETNYWLELLGKSSILPAKRLADLLKETDELIAILTASVRTAKRNKK